jgi:hypothetical protein
MKRTLKRNQKFDFRRVINVSKPVDMNDFVHDKNYCAEYVESPDSPKEWAAQYRKEHNVAKMDYQAVMSFVMNCVKFPNGYYWDIDHSASDDLDRANATVVKMGYLNRRSHQFDPLRTLCITFYATGRIPDSDCSECYPSFLGWAQGVMKKAQKANEEIQK